MSSDFGGDSFESLAELVEFEDEAGESVGFAVVTAVLLHYGAQLCPPVEGGFAAADP